MADEPQAPTEEMLQALPPGHELYWHPEQGYMARPAKPQALTPGWGSRVASSVGGILDLSKYAGRGVAALGGGETAQAVGTGLAAIPATLVAGASVLPTAAGEALRPVGEAIGRNLPAPGLQAGSEALDPAQFGAERMGPPSPEGRAAAGQAVGEFAALGGSMGAASGMARIASGLFRKLMNTGLAAGARNQTANEIINNIAPAVQQSVKTPSADLFDVLASVPGETPVALPSTPGTLAKVAGQEAAGSGAPASGLSRPWPGVYKGSLEQGRTDVYGKVKTYDLTEAATMGGVPTELGQVPLPAASKELIGYSDALRQEIVKSPDLHVGLDTLRATVTQLGDRISQPGLPDRLRGAYKAVYRSLQDDIRAGANRTGNPELKVYADAMKAYHTEQTAQDLSDFLQKSGMGRPQANGLIIANPEKAIAQLQKPLTPATKELVRDLRQIGAYEGVVSELQRAAKFTAAGKPKAGLSGQVESSALAGVGGLAAHAVGASTGTSVVTGALTATLYHGMARLLMSTPGRAMVKSAIEGGGGIINQRAALAASLAGRTSLHRAFEAPASMQPALAETNFRKPSHVPPDSVVLDLSKPFTGAR